MASSRRQNLQLTKHAGVTPAEDLKEVHVWCCSPVTFGFVSNHQVYIYIHMYYMCIYIYTYYINHREESAGEVVAQLSTDFQEMAAAKAFQDFDLGHERILGILGILQGSNRI